MKRVNIYLTEKQIERLHQRAEKEGIPIGVGIKDVQTHIDTDPPSRPLVLDVPLGMHSELHIVAICATHETYTLDLLHGEGFNMLVRIAN